jgi:hypothetical protein
VGANLATTFTISAVSGDTFGGKFKKRQKRPKTCRDSFWLPSTLDWQMVSVVKAFLGVSARGVLIFQKL